MASSLVDPRRPRTWLLFLLTIGLAHVVTVLVMARPGETAALGRLHAASPANTFNVLDPLTPANQPLPFLMPESVYAVCPFDVSTSPIRITAALPTEGWLLSLHALDGTSFYFAPGTTQQELTLTIDVIPAGEALNGLELAARPEDMKIAKVEAPEPRGIAVIRAPVAGRAYLGQAVQDLGLSSCRAIGRSAVRR